MVGLWLGVWQAVLWYWLAQYFSFRWWVRSIPVGVILAVAPTLICPTPFFFGVAPLVFIAQGCLTGLLIDRLFPSGRCPGCGYDLASKAAYTCPKCGAVAAD